MKWNFVTALLVAPALTGCAADLSNYVPPLDPALATSQTAAHLAYCKALIRQQSAVSPSGWKGMLQQAAQSSIGAWVSAAELATVQAVEAAAGYTLFGALLGIHTDDNSRQSRAKSNVRMCMVNYGEGVTEKP